MRELREMRDLCVFVRTQGLGAIARGHLWAASRSGQPFFSVAFEVSGVVNFLAHLCELHGGLICVAFRLSVRLSVCD